MDPLDMSLEELTAAARASRKSQATGRAAQSRAKRRAKASPYGSRSARKGTTGGRNARVYVNNLNYDTDWRGLKAHFATAGEVVRADVLVKDNGRSKGCGIVEFSSGKEANAAIRRLNGSTLDGRDILVREDREDAPVARRGGAGGAGAGSRPSSFTSFSKGSNKTPPGAVRLFVNNLNYRVEWKHLKDAFAECGKVLYADVMTGSDGRSKGCGIVEMANAAGAKAAIAAYNGQPMDGRRVEVRYDREAPARDATTRRSSFAGDSSANKVFVGGLSYDAKWTDLKDHFAAVGDVAYAKVFEESDGRSKGCGIVEFVNASDAKQALARLNGSMLKGRPVHLRPDGGNESRGVHVRKAKGTASTNRVHVGNLSYKVTWEELKDTFKQWGNVEYAKVATEDDDSRSRGWGIVEFSNNREAALAIANADGIYMDGRKIWVKEDEKA